MAVAGKVAITLSTENGGAWSADVTYDRLVAVKHNNNLYISRKTVANVEPPNNEFWFLALEGFGGDDIEDIINGTTQVGNAKTLDGHEAEYFAPKTDLANYIKADGSNGWVSSVSDLNAFYTGVTVVRYCENIPSDNWWLVIAGGVYGTTVQTAYQLHGDETPKQRYCAGGTWSGWFDLNKDYLPLTGGTVANNNYVPLVVKNNSNDGGTWFRFDYSNETLGYLGFGSKDALLFKTGGQTANYELLHTGNKPTGTYTGNGSATERTIVTGGIGSICCISGNGYTAIVHKNGAFVMSYVATSVAVLQQEQMLFSNGTLIIKSDSAAINGNGISYTYQVL